MALGYALRSPLRIASMRSIASGFLASLFFAFGETGSFAIAWSFPAEGRTIWAVRVVSENAFAGGIFLDVPWLGFFDLPIIGRPPRASSSARTFPCRLVFR